MTKSQRHVLGVDTLSAGYTHRLMLSWSILMEWLVSVRYPLRDRLRAAKVDKALADFCQFCFRTEKHYSIGVHAVLAVHSLRESCGMHGKL